MNREKLISFIAIIICLLLMLSACNFPTGQNQDNSANESDYWLGEAYPNPISVGGTTTIEYNAKAGTEIQLVITNVLEQEVLTYVISEGHGGFVWNGQDRHGRLCGSGVYFYQMHTGMYTSTRKMLLIR
jgi:hypothetical protein